MTEALEDALSAPGTQLAVGSGESYAILHSTVLGLEAKDQMAQDFGEAPDVVIGSLGAGSNFGGIAMPFVGDKLRHGTRVRCISVEPRGCPKLTRGAYRYDVTDGSGITPLQKMYTLGSQFRTAARGPLIRGPARSLSPHPARRCSASPPSSSTPWRPSRP